MNLDSGTQIQTISCCMWKATHLAHHVRIQKYHLRAHQSGLDLDNTIIYFLFFSLFLFVLIKLINYKKNVLNFLQMQTNEPYPNPAIEMDLKRGDLYFFPLDLICILSYKKSFICKIIFEKFFVSPIDQHQVGFCGQS